MRYRRSVHAFRAGGEEGLAGFHECCARRCDVVDKYNDFPQDGALIFHGEGSFEIAHALFAIFQERLVLGIFDSYERMRIVFENVGCEPCYISRDEFRLVEAAFPHAFAREGDGDEQIFF